MKEMKKVEVIVESVYMKRLLELFRENNIEGYTLIKDIEGCGGHGLKSADEVTDVFSNDYIFTLCKESEFENMKEDIRAFIKRYGGKCIVSDATLLL